MERQLAGCFVCPLRHSENASDLRDLSGELQLVPEVCKDAEALCVVLHVALG